MPLVRAMYAMTLNMYAVCVAPIRRVTVAAIVAAVIVSFNRQLFGAQQLFSGGRYPIPTVFDIAQPDSFGTMPYRD